MPEMSLRAYAKHKGVHLNAVQKAIKSGRINRLENGKVDSEEADRLWDLRSNPSKRTMPPGSGQGPSRGKVSDQVAVDKVAPSALAGTVPPGESKATKSGGNKEAGAENSGDHDYWKSRAKREQYEAELAKIKYEEQIGSIVKKDTVESEAFEEGKLLRDRILIIPDRIDAILAAETDSKKVNKILSDELKAALLEIANAPIPVGQHLPDQL